MNGIRRFSFQKFKEVTAARDAEIARREGTTNEMEEEEKEGDDKKVVSMMER